MVVFIRDGKNMGDSMVTDLGVVRDKLVSVDFECLNDTDTHMVDLQAVTNLPKEAYTFTTPVAISPGVKVRMRLTLDTQRIWDAKIKQIAFKVDYDLVHLVQTS